MKLHARTKTAVNSVVSRIHDLKENYKNRTSSTLAEAPSSPNDAPPDRKIIEVTLHHSGPMHISLKMHPSKEYVYLSRFATGEDGSIGEVQQDGRVCVGDALISINGVSLENRTFSDVLSIIRHESEYAPERVLQFARTVPPAPPLKPIDALAALFNSTDEFPLEALRNIAVYGLPQEYRTAVWMMLLGYLPLSKSQWADHLQKHRTLYRSLISELQAAPSHEENHIDHPLNTEADSSWNKYFNDVELLDSIQKDVDRTHPELSFYLVDDGKEQKALLNILFLYAKLNPAVGYVQGMNELVGTMYYEFATHCKTLNEVCTTSADAEADTFFCFSLLMSDIQDLYIRKMDETSLGIHGCFEKFDDMLRSLDNQIYTHLRAQGIETSFYTLRWFTTLFSREFDLLDTLRYWDSLFAEVKRTEFLTCTCCVLVIELREELLRGDFAENLKLLQTYPPIDICHLLHLVNLLKRNEYPILPATAPPRPTILHAIEHLRHTPLQNHLSALSHFVHDASTVVKSTVHDTIQGINKNRAAIFREPPRGGENVDALPSEIG